MRYLNGSSQIVFYSNTFEGLFTANLTNIDFASISEGSCNSVCVSVVFNGDIPVTRTGTFMLVDALYNGKKYYAGTIDGILYLIVWENASPAGWYLKDPNPSGGVIGYVTNHLNHLELGYLIHHFMRYHLNLMFVQLRVKFINC